MTEGKHLKKMRDIGGDEGHWRIWHWETALSRSGMKNRWHLASTLVGGWS